jgi:hypothetical protein
LSVFRFPLPPIRPLQHDAGEAYELVEDLLDENGVVVEAGYVTDLASVPRPFRVLLPTSGKITPAAIRHDRRCDDLNEWYEAWVAAGRPEQADGIAYAGRLIPRPELTAVEADREFLDGLRQLDPEHPLRNLGYWLGVRLGAVANPARRAGWHTDAGHVLLALLVVAPLLVPVAVVNGAALAVDALANRLACRLARRSFVEVVVPEVVEPERVAA